jgi:hypothetical protein
MEPNYLYLQERGFFVNSEFSQFLAPNFFPPFWGQIVECKRENPKFLKNFRSKNNTQQKIMTQNFGLMSDIVIQSGYSKVKLLYYFALLCVFHTKIF